MKRASVAENSELMEKHLLPRVMYSRNFFFSPSQNACDLFILFRMGQFLGKSCVRGDGLRSTGTCRRGQWAGIFNPGWPMAAQPQPRARPGPPQLPLSSPGAAGKRIFKCSSFPKLLAILSPLKLLALILNLFVRFGRHLYWHCQNSWDQMLSRDAAVVVEAILIFFCLFFFF